MTDSGKSESTASENPVTPAGESAAQSLPDQKATGAPKNLEEAIKSATQDLDLDEVSKKAKIWGWVVLIIGILALLAPLVSGLAVTMMVGVLLVFAGVFRLFHAFKGGGFWSGLFGVLAVVGGLFMLGHIGLGLFSLTLVLIAYFIALGITEIIAAFRLKPVKGWGFLLFSGIMSLVLGLLIWAQWPLSGTWAVGVLVGVQLIFAGMTMITLGSTMKNNQSENSAA